MTGTDINGVLDRHDEEIMAIDGVIGIYVGAVDPDEDPPRLCLRVLVLEDTPALRKRIPESIEGWPVVIEPSDPIRPLGAGG